MGNFVVLPLFHRPLNSSKNDIELKSIDSQPIQEDTNKYHVNYDPSIHIESSLWINIKSRTKNKKLSNRIRTTRYNLLTFIPKNLFEQFHRVANIYFAILIVLNWIPVINAIAKTVAFLPLTVILVITAVKDLVEDLKRWRSDVYINKQLTEVYD
ncbi:unnamed protein product, partial [Rotaria magnacalcarata]